VRMPNCPSFSFFSFTGMPPLSASSNGLAAIFWSRHVPGHADSPKQFFFPFFFLFLWDALGEQVLDAAL